MLSCDIGTSLTTKCPGVTLVQIPLLEELFQINIEVFDFLKKEEALVHKLCSTNTVFVYSGSVYNKPATIWKINATQGVT